MALTTITWATGEVIDETRMNAQVTNTALAYGEAEYKYLLSGDIWEIGTSEVDPGWQVTINGAVVTGDTVDESLSTFEYYVGGLTNGTVYELTLELTETSFVQTYRWVKTPDLDYISGWVNPFTSSLSAVNYRHGFHDVTIIGHSETGQII